MIQSTPVTGRTSVPAGPDRPVRVRSGGSREDPAPRSARTTSRLPEKMSTSTRPVRRSPPAGGSLARRRRRVAGRASRPCWSPPSAAFAAGVVVGRGGDDPRRTTAQAFVDAWARGDYVSMRALLTPEDRRAIPQRRFSNAYRNAAQDRHALGGHRRPRRASRTRTAASPCRCSLRTRLFGTLRGTLALPVVEQEDGAGDRLGPHLVHPGLRPGEKLTRETSMPPRAAIQARDGTPLAEGEARLSELGALASEIAGRVGPGAARARRRAGAARRAAGRARRPDRARARVRRRAGRARPAASCAAGGRVLASAEPRRGERGAHDDRPRHPARRGRRARRPLRRRRGDAAGRRRGARARRDRLLGAAAARLGVQDRHAGRRARRGRRQAVAGATPCRRPRCSRASSWRTPTASRAAARSRTASPTPATPSSRRWAPSWAPSGSWRRPSTSASTRIPGLAGAMRSTIPAAAEIGDDLAVGSTAIGQGKVLATPLLMAGIAGTIAERGMRVRPTLRKGAAPERTRAMPEPVARTIGSLHARGGHVGDRGERRDPGRQGRRQDRHRGAARHDERRPGPERPGRARRRTDTTDTNAWFAAYAPMRRPRAAVAVMLVGQGAGGETAAPVARQVLEAALKR